MHWLIPHHTALEQVGALVVVDKFHAHLGIEAGEDEGLVGRLLIATLAVVDGGVEVDAVHHFLGRCRNGGCDKQDCENECFTHQWG